MVVKPDSSWRMAKSKASEEGLERTCSDISEGLGGPLVDISRLVLCFETNLRSRPDWKSQ